MASSLRRLLLVLVAALAVILPAIVFSQSPGAIPIPISIGAHSSVPSGLQSTVTFDARGVGGAANAGYYSRPVLVSNNTLGGLAKGMVRRAAPVAAMTAAITAAGWAIDELSGQVMDGEPVEPPGPVPPGGVYYVWGNNYYSSASAATAAVMKLMDYPGAPHKSHRYSEIDFQADPDTRVLYVCHHAETWSASQHLNYSSFYERRNATAFPQAYPWADALPQPQPVPDAALGQLVKDNPALWDQALRNPDGSVNRNPDVQAAAQALANELANPQGPQPDPTAGWDQGTQGGNPAPNTSVELEFPAFCSWASVVCDAIDWLRAPDDSLDDIPIPYEDIPLTSSNWVSGLGNGSCPAPRAFGLSSGSFELSYQPACDLGGYLRPLVIISAILLGAFIVVGSGRQG